MNDESIDNRSVYVILLDHEHAPSFQSHSEFGKVKKTEFGINRMRKKNELDGTVFHRTQKYSFALSRILPRLKMSTDLNIL